MDRVVVVTGGTSGVGRACARAFAEDGDDVAVLARGHEGLRATVAEVEARGRRAHAVPVDVADADAVAAAASEVESVLGPVDVWVNAAMTSVFAPVAETTPAEFERVVRVTCLGSVFSTMAVLPLMRERDRGHVIQVGSALAFRGIPLQAAYCTSKHGLNGFYDALRAELHHDRSNVRVSTVHLPAVNTPQFDVVRNKLGRHGQPVPPIYQPEVAADATVWLSHHPRRRELWVGTSTVGTIWAGRLVPGLLDRYLGRTGYDSQQTDDRWPPDAPDYLQTPVPGDRGAHGDFDDEARERSPALAVAKHRRVLGVAALAAGAAVAGLAGRPGSRR